MNKIQKVALCWLIFSFAFFLGLYVCDTEVWPYNHFIEVKDFIQGDSEESLSLKEKIKNDLDFKPSRHIKTAEKGNGRWIQLSEGFESEKHRELKGLKLNPRRDNPNIFLAENAQQGYRLLYGTFDFEEELHGAVLLDSRGKVAHVWHISQAGIAWEHQPDTNTFPHGLEVARDGSIVVAYDEGNSMTKYDYCGNVVWQIDGIFHHSIAFDGESAVWSWKRRSYGEYEVGERLVKVDFQTGEILKEIPLPDVVNANLDIDIFAPVQDDTPAGSKWAKVSSGYWHVNDIDPLPQEWEALYPMFSAGDLLISLRSPNLVFVMDPETLKVKWWRQGLTRRQHDPDWSTEGTITIFNNNMHRDYSNIMEVNPVTYEHNIAVDGKKYNFYTWWRGKHQRLPNGGFLITSADQGRVFEIDGNGEITFEFLNTYKRNQEYLAISEARFLSTDFFEDLPQCEQVNKIE